MSLSRFLHTSTKSPNEKNQGCTKRSWILKVLTQLFENQCYADKLTSCRYFWLWQEIKNSTFKAKLCSSFVTLEHWKQILIHQNDNFILYLDLQLNFHTMAWKSFLLNGFLSIMDMKQHIMMGTEMANCCDDHYYKSARSLDTLPVSSGT